MSRPKRKRKLKVKFRQSAKLVERNDNTRVARADTVGQRRAPVRLTGDNAANFRIKLRRKK